MDGTLRDVARKSCSQKKKKGKEKSASKLCVVSLSLGHKWLKKKTLFSQLPCKVNQKDETEFTGKLQD